MTNCGSKLQQTLVTVLVIGSAHPLYGIDVVGVGVGVCVPVVVCVGVGVGVSVCVAVTLAVGV